MNVYLLADFFFNLNYSTCALIYRPGILQLQGMAPGAKILYLQCFVHGSFISSACPVGKARKGHGTGGGGLDVESSNPASLEESTPGGKYHNVQVHNGKYWPPSQCFTSS